MDAVAGRRLALIIASSNYEDKTLRQLITPGQDAEALARVLADPQIGEYEVTTLVNRSASEIHRAIEGFFANRKRDDLLLLYFSGHGIKDEAGRLFLAAADTQREFLRASAIAASFIHDSMDESRSQRQVLILDCCHSGAFPKGMSPKGAETVGIQEQFGSGRGRAILTASNAFQYAFEGGTVQSLQKPTRSVFTRHLVEGLESGEADDDRDGWISLDELYEYVYERVKEEMPNQTPQMRQDVEGNIFIARNPRPQPIVAPPVSPDEVSDSVKRRRIQALWIDALDFFYQGKWAEARDALQHIVELQPDFRDAASKLKEAERQHALADWYEKAVTAEKAARWEEAIAQYTHVVESDAQYRDAATRLTQAKEQSALARLYDEARELARDERWESVLGVFAKIDVRHPGYPDPDGLRSKAEAGRRSERLAALYVEGLEALDHSDWQKAVRSFEALEREQRGYRQTPFHLAKAREQLAAAKRAETRPEPSPATARPSVERQTTEPGPGRAEPSALPSILQQPAARTIATLAVAAMGCWIVAASPSDLAGLKKTLIYADTSHDLPLETVVMWGLMVSIPGLALMLFNRPTRRLIGAALVSGPALVIGIYVFAFGFASSFAPTDQFEYPAIVEQSRILLLGSWLGLVWGLTLALTLSTATGRRAWLLLPFGIVSIAAATFLSISPLVEPEIPNLGADGAILGWVIWGAAAAGILLRIISQSAGRRSTTQASS